MRIAVTISAPRVVVLGTLLVTASMLAGCDAEREGADTAPAAAAEADTAAAPAADGDANADADAFPDAEADTAAAAETEAGTAAAAAADAAADAAAGAGTGTGTGTTPDTGARARFAISGRVVYRGPLPETTRMHILEAGWLDAHTVHVDAATGGLRDVMIFVEGERSTRPARELEPLVLDQREFSFLPHVIGVRVGRTLRFVNSDVSNHTVHSFDAGFEFNVGTPSGESAEHVFRRTTGTSPVRLGCDIHPWMRAWVYVFDHELFARTDASGRFRIEGVPAGRRRLVAHHADASLERRIEVAVGPDTRELEIVLETDALPPPEE